MSGYTNKAGIFVRNALQRKSNGTVDPLLSKIEDNIYTIGEFVKQRSGQKAFENLLNHVSTEKEITL